MKKFTSTLIISILFAATAVFSQTVNVTLRVNMQDKTVSPDGVHVAGSFQGWDPSSSEMTTLFGNVYEYTLTASTGDHLLFKFINGNDWPQAELVPAVCGEDDGFGGYNRYFDVPAFDTTLTAVCFGSCLPCVVPQVNVTFQVDMSNETVSADGVHIAGSFNGWDTDSTEMLPVGNGIYAVTFELDQGAYYEYKFLNGNAWGTQEVVPETCGVDDGNGAYNRFLEVPATDSTLSAVCFGSCNICNPPLHDVTFTVDMSTQNISPEGVHIAGTLNNWDTIATQLTNTSGNYYQVTLSLGENDFHEFKYLNGNTWLSAEFVPGDCNYNGNRYLTVPGSNTILDTVCFGECDACTSQLYTFNLTVFLEGPFNGSVMNSDLYNYGVIPNEQPYNTAPWNYDGQETMNVPPETPVVDWVLVEFRETSGDASTAASDKFLDHQAALLLEDGSIVKPDGVSSIQYNGDITENLYVIVYHRNHLAVMSATALSGFGTTYIYNFTTALSKAYLDGQKDLGGGYFGMISGDSDGNNTVVQSDKDDSWNLEAGNYGYYGSDLNLDAQVNNPDKNGFWEPNIGSSTKIDLPFTCGGQFTDLRDGQAYNTVMIGSQCWMSGNLNVGTAINGSNNQTDNGIIEKYCYDNITANCDEYGALYQWNEMMQYTLTSGTQGVCPAGWHIPTDTEWCTLENEVDAGTVACSTFGMRGINAGGNLKEAGTTHWTAPNMGATNSSGFTGLPAGYISAGHTFGNLGSNTYFWSSTEDGTNGINRGLHYNYSQVGRGSYDKGTGFCVRCIKD